ncbi:MAG: hypothetical protein GWN01_05280 [Nitrosopumilaceae archaeon]|nr:hypothetical protein [Nitrosopumilaceae archaeon]NIU00356.1 hypothetical protein [Nitrosopumilaceae archaeon]NIU86758.1 hypothetical protein [Nitrosopumilaceae archaeon]NIV65458.1 hypothetical protein [Nitrosopumilaceae archaeon]NIX60958.1 hypothetical protein [Nitrosopumilaceae archaeon]
MKISKKEIDGLRSILKKIENEEKNQKMRIKGRTKMQKQGKSLNKGKVRNRQKPVRKHRKVTKKRSSIK